MTLIYEYLVYHFANYLQKRGHMDASEYDMYCRNARETIKQYDFAALIDELESILRWEVGRDERTMGIL